MASDYKTQIGVAQEEPCSPADFSEDELRAPWGEVVAQRYGINRVLLHGRAAIAIAHHAAPGHRSSGTVPPGRWWTYERQLRPKTKPCRH